MRRLVPTLAAAAAALAVVFATPLAAQAAELVAPAPGSVGTDVSEIQGADGLPSAAPFAIVNVNDGLPNGRNASLQEQIAWADGLPGATGEPGLQFYVNTANPGAAAARWWPRGATTQHGTAVAVPTAYGSCTHTTSRACAYVYGYSMVLADLGVAADSMLPMHQAGSYRWWLDVETANSWNGSTAVNRADLEGMVAAFRDAHAAVGIYSTHKQWKAITGETVSGGVFTGLANWLAGATTTHGAQQQCTSAPITTGGRVTLTQWWDGVDGHLDNDLVCGSLSTGSPRVSGTAAPGLRLTAEPGAWTSGTSLAFQWLRNGRTIPGATGADYLVRPADRGAALSVRITGIRLGDSRAVRTSASVTAGRAFDAVSAPTLSGTPQAGRALTVHLGRWAPAGSVRYQWYRNGAAIPGATSERYTVTAVDEGGVLAVSVTVRKRGFATTTRTSAPTTPVPLSV